MLIAMVLMLIALAANVWLWGQWSFDKPTWWNFTLVINTILLLVAYGVSAFRVYKKRSIKKALNFRPLYVCAYTVVILTLILFRHDFQFLITSIIVIKFISAVVLFFYKQRKKKKKKNDEKNV